jgi:LuxR family maltose regulon positive regulatory protein
MAGPLLETKLQVPTRRRDLVARPRLSERLSRGAESELMLVSAPAGFGKTTLLADWLTGSASSGRAAAWLSLDQRDNDPALFWMYVVTALNTTYRVGADAIMHLQSPQHSIEAVIASLLNDLQGVSNDVVLARRRRPRHSGWNGLSLGAPSSTGTRRDRQPRRPAAAAREITRAW